MTVVKGRYYYDNMGETVGKGKIGEVEVGISLPTKHIMENNNTNKYEERETPVLGSQMPSRDMAWNPNFCPLHFLSFIDFVPLYKSRSLNKCTKPAVLGLPQLGFHHL